MKIEKQSGGAKHDSDGENVSPPDYPAQWNPASTEPLRIGPLDQADQAAFEEVAAKTRRLTEDKLSKPFTDQL
jgi:hypothetical protein